MVKRKNFWGNKRRDGKRAKLIRKKIRLSRAVRQKVYNFTRSCTLTDLSGSDVSDVFGGLSFNLGQLPNYTEFTNLFDQFRICGIRLEIIPKYTSVDLNPLATTVAMPNIHTVIDYNDIATPGNLEVLLQYPNYKRTRGNAVHKRYFKPAVLASNYEGAVTSAYTSKWGQWLDSIDYPTVHYGLRYGIDQSFTGARYRVYAKFYIQCKDPK